MKKKVIIIVAFILLALIAIPIITSGDSSNKSAETTKDKSTQTATSTTETAKETPKDPGQVAVEKSREYIKGCPELPGNIIVYDLGAFEYMCITVKKGSKVVFSNKSNQPIQIGSDPHPSHTGNKEISNNAFTLDVAPLSQASTGSLNTLGDHPFHNHLDPIGKGKVVVVE